MRDPALVHRFGLEALDCSSHDGSAQIDISRVGSVIYQRKDIFNPPFHPMDAGWLSLTSARSGVSGSLILRARFSPLTFGERNDMRGNFLRRAEGRQRLKSSPGQSPAEGLSFPAPLHRTGNGLRLVKARPEADLCSEPLS